MHAHHGDDRDTADSDGAGHGWECREWTAGLQLLDEKMNVEYVAANLEAGALRARALGLDPPSAFNAVIWHQQGVQIKEEIEKRRLHQYTLGPVWVLDDIGIPLDI